MKIFFVFLFYGLVCGSSSPAQELPAGPPSQDLAAGPKGGAAGSVWSIPETQMALIAVDGGVYYLAYKFARDPEFRRAASAFEDQKEARDAAVEKRNKLQQKIHDNQMKLQMLEAQRQALDVDLKTNANTIETKRIAMAESQTLLTIDDKVLEFARVNRRMESLHGPALTSHKTELHNIEEIYANQPEFQELKHERNKLVRMPDLTGPQKQQRIEDAKRQWEESVRSKELILKNMEEKNIEIEKQAIENEGLNPQLLELQEEIKLEQTATIQAENFRNSVAARKGMSFKRFTWFVGRWLVYGILAINIEGRVYHYLIRNEDPGWFPFDVLPTRPQP